MAAITVRPLRSDAERDAFFLLAMETFSTHPDAAATARWRRFVETGPKFDFAQLRGAFRGEDWLGGCIIYERVLAIGPARLTTACIGALVTHLEHRRQGVAAAMLDDALAFARERGHALLLLDGIPGFYQRFGYTDVLESTQHHISLADIDRLPDSSYHVRDAVLDDAPDLLRLYHEAFDPYPGVFARTLPIQEHHLRTRLPHNPPLVVEDPGAHVCGYAAIPWPRQRPYCPEVVFAEWPAAAALLKAQARLLRENGEAPERLWWQVPPQSAAFYALIDNIHVESATHHIPNCDWMARIGLFPRFMQAMLPFWRERWRQANLSWRGQLAITVGESTFYLSLRRGEVRMMTRPRVHTARIQLTPQALVQFVFGFRPVTWLARQPGCIVPEPVFPILQTLMPDVPGWLPGTDWF